MKKSARYTALALVTLTSALLLGACGGNKQETTTASSSTRTSQSSKLSNSSTKAKTEKKTQAKTEKKAQSASSEDMKESTVSQESQPAKQAETVKEDVKEKSVVENKQTSSVDIDALLKGDFTSVAGTYQNDLGSTITVSENGSVTLTRGEDGTVDISSQLINKRTQGDSFVATFTHNDGPSSDPIFFDNNGQIRFGSDKDYADMHVFSKIN